MHSDRAVPEPLGPIVKPTIKSAPPKGTRTRADYYEALERMATICHERGTSLAAELLPLVERWLRRNDRRQHP